MNVPVSTTASGSQWRTRSSRATPATAAGGREVIVDMTATVPAAARHVDYLPGNGTEPGSPAGPGSAAGMATKMATSGAISTTSHAAAARLARLMSPPPTDEAGQPPSDLWRGERIEVARNAVGKPVWAWWNCVRCHRELISGRAIAVGLHPICLRRAARPRGCAKQRATLIESGTCATTASGRKYEHMFGV
jgi:hypothetical protein